MPGSRTPTPGAPHVRTTRRTDTDASVARRGGVGQHRDHGAEYQTAHTTAKCVLHIGVLLHVHEGVASTGGLLHHVDQVLALECRAVVHAAAIQVLDAALGLRLAAGGQGGDDRADCRRVCAATTSRSARRRSVINEIRSKVVNVRE